MKLSDAALDAAIDTYFGGPNPGVSRQYLRQRFQDVADALAPHIRRQAGEDVAYRIRAELVCCDIYDLDAGTKRAGRTHSICFWGEAGARIAEYVTTPEGERDDD